MEEAARTAGWPPEYARGLACTGYYLPYKATGPRQHGVVRREDVHAQEVLRVMKPVRLSTSGLKR